MANAVLPCKYFNTPTGCRNGANCSFAHALSMKPPCRFFGSQVGCRFGDACMYSHDNEVKHMDQGVPAGRSRGRGRGRGRFQSRGGFASSSSSGMHDRQWYGNESDEENAPPPSRYKPESKLNDLLSWGLKPTPEGWEEYAAIQRAFKGHDEDVEMQESGMNEMLNELTSFGLQPTPEGWDAYHAIKDEMERGGVETEMGNRGRGRGRGAATLSYSAYDMNGSTFHARGRGGRGRGGYN